jgi:hypothetical protein
MRGHALIFKDLRRSNTVGFITHGRKQNHDAVWTGCAGDVPPTKEGLRAGGELESCQKAG